jgi:hypothetical protein
MPRAGAVHLIIRDEACTAWHRAVPKPDIARQARDPSTAEAILL